MEEDVSFDPAGVGLLGAQAAAPRGRTPDNLIQQARPRDAPPGRAGCTEPGTLSDMVSSLSDMTGMINSHFNRKRQLIGLSDKLFTFVFDVDITLGV
jgi:hypothetical protein